MNSYHLLPPSLPPPYHLKALKYFNSYHLTAFLLQNIVTRALSCFEEGGKVERGGKAVREQARHPLGVCPVLSRHVPAGKDRTCPDICPDLSGTTKTNGE